MKELLSNLFRKMVNKYNKTELPKNKNIYKWLGKTEPNYILEFNKYDLFSLRINEVLNNLRKNKKPVSETIFNQVKYLEDKIDKYCLKITLDYEEDYKELFLSKLSSL
jgi:hypothetical protein